MLSEKVPVAVSLNCCGELRGIDGLAGEIANETRLGMRVMLTPLLAIKLEVVTFTFPVVAPVGTVTEMLLSLQLCTVALTLLLNVTPPKPCDAPKPLPVMTTVVPTVAAVGWNPLMFGCT